MYARVSTYAIPPTLAKHDAETFRRAIADIGKLPGLEYGYVLVSEEHDTVLTVTMWRTHDDLAASRVRATRLRTVAANEAGAAVTSTVEYRVV